MRKDAELAPHVPPNFAELTVHAPAELMRTCSAMGMRAPTTPCLANVFVVDDPTKPPRCKLWSAVLLGGLLVDKDYIVKAGRAGRCVAYARALNLSRTMYMSRTFMAEHQVLAKTLINCIRDSHRKTWCVLRTEDDWVNSVLAKPRNACQHVAFVGAAEAPILRGRVAAIARNIRHIGGVDVLSAHAQVDPIRSKLGGCGR